VLDEKMKDEVKITVIATGFRSEGRQRQPEEVSSFSVTPPRSLQWTAPQSEPQITRRADAGYETRLPEEEPVLDVASLDAPAPDARFEQAVEDSLPVPDVETARAAAAPATRVWEAVPPPRSTTAPVVSMDDLGIEADQDELDVPAYLRKKSQDF